MFNEFLLSKLRLIYVKFQPFFVNSFNIYKQGVFVTGNSDCIYQDYVLRDKVKEFTITTPVFP